METRHKFVWLGETRSCESPPQQQSQNNGPAGRPKGRKMGDSNRFKVRQKSHRN